MARSLRPGRLLLLVALVAAAIVVPFLLWGARVDAWVDSFVRSAAARPLPAALVLGGLLAADVVAPVPSGPVSTACGLLLGFGAGLLVSFAGMSLGALAGYALGRAVRAPAAALAGDPALARLERLRGRWGVWLVAALRPVPVLAEASVLFAGLARLPARRVVPALLLANLGVSAVYAAAGAWAASAHAFLPAFAAALLLPGLAMLAGRRLTRRA
jgi:uncharacterized membrane protein YdjX (TVP38/TMEM64 family)